MMTSKAKHQEDFRMSKAKQLKETFTLHNVNERRNTLTNEDIQNKKEANKKKKKKKRRKLNIKKHKPKKGEK